MKNLFLIIAVLSFTVSNAQLIFHPAGKSHKNVMIKPGAEYHYYDNGGPNANYGAGTSSIVTIYPNEDGQYVSLSCNSFEINSDCRMYIFDGNHPGAPILKYVNTHSSKSSDHLKVGDVITASAENPSGALSIRFTNIKHRATLPGWDFTATCTSQPGPAPLTTSQDCSGAIKVCSDNAITTKASGYHIQELPGPHFWNTILNYGKDGENQSNWYKFEVASPGTIEFLIKPHQTTDFDWALWGPYKMHECPAWTTDKSYRLSSCDGDYSQITGLSRKATDTHEDSGGNGYVKAIDVKAGEHYVIMIDDWSGNKSTFDLTWSFLNGASLECKEDKEPPKDPPPVLDSVIVSIDTTYTEEVIQRCLDTVKVQGLITPESEIGLGAIDIIVKGGSSPYKYVWKDKSGQMVVHTQNLTEVKGGNYNLGLVDAEGCEYNFTFEVDVSSKFVEEEPDEPELEAELDAEQTFVTVSYPGKFEYKIVDENRQTVITGHSKDEDVVEITRLPPGTYRVSLIHKKIRQYTIFVKE